MACRSATRYPRGSKPVVAVVFACLASASAWSAEADSEPAFTYSATASGLQQFESDLDDGGRYGVGTFMLRAGGGWRVSEQLRAGVTASYDFIDYRFENPTAFGGQAPWDVVQRIGLAFPLSWAGASGWFASVVPSFDFIGENGSSWSDSLSYGATFSGGKAYAADKRLGLGVGVFSRPEETTVFPFLIVDWALTDRLRLTNPLTAGPTGPAGLELLYAIGGGWEVGGGAAYRSLRFRLDEGGSTPSGVGEERGVATFLHATKRIDKTFEVGLYAGAVVAGKLRLEDSGGALITGEDFGFAPILAISLAGRF